MEHGTMTVARSWDSEDSGDGTDHRDGGGGGEHSSYTFLLPPSFYHHFPLPQDYLMPEA